MNKIFKLFSLLLFLSVSVPVLAQVNPQNLSNVRVDELSDDQVLAFMRQVESSGMGEAQLEQIAKARGMNPAEVGKLRARLDKLKPVGSKSTNPDQKKPVNKGRELNYDEDKPLKEIDPESEAEKALSELRAKIFGADLFKNKNQTFEPNINIATPKD